MKTNVLSRVLLLLAAQLISACAANNVWRYELLEGSTLLDQCLICGRPDIFLPMRGSFTLRQGTVSPISQNFTIENADFTAQDYHFTGSGTYVLSGDFAVRQIVTLQGDLVIPGGTTRKVAFTNQTSAPLRRWPMLEFAVQQTNGTLISTITLQVDAAPLREIWFSTTGSFHSATKAEPDNSVLAGDLLSNAGRIVKHNSELQAKFPGPTFLDIGLDAIDILPGAQLMFSGNTLGVLSDGDFANANSGAITRWPDFMSLVTTTDTDPGLDALQFVSPTEFYFSIKTNTESARNGDLIHVDTANGTGEIAKNNKELLAAFHPSVGDDYGLDAVYIWPTGETWFSVETGFNDNNLGPVTAGDLLSDAGYIVFRNLELVSKFSPIEDVSNFGLDALTVISDYNATPGEPSLTAAYNKPNDSIMLSWSKAVGRVFQVERARNVTGPWELASPIIPDLSYEDFDNVSGNAAAFYRLRQW